MSSELQQLVDAINGGASVLVVTGAGVSLASGIPTFRGNDPGATWSRNVTSLGTLAHYRSDPVSSWKWYQDRFSQLRGKRPNPAHHALASLERWQRSRGGEFLLATQNVDGLQRVAGSEALVEVHGRADRFRCSAEGCVYGAPKGTLRSEDVDVSAFEEEPVLDHVPRCPACGELLRHHVLWFDEKYTGHRDFQIARVLRAAKRSAVVLFAGTSLSVGVTDMVVEQALRPGHVVFNVDPFARETKRRIVDIKLNAEDALPRLVAALR